MTGPTVVKNAEWVVAWDGRQHRLLPQGTVVFEGDTIVFAGKEYTGPAAAELDASGCLVIPGLVDIHSHLSTEGRNKGFLEDQGNRKLGMSGLYEYLPAMGPVSPALTRAVLRFALVELLQSGCTTIVELGAHDEEGLQVFNELGIRAYVCPMFKSGAWYTPNGHELRYRWDEAGGREGLRQAVKFIEDHSGRFGGRLQSMLAPAQVDTCTADLLRETKRAAADLGVPVQLHAAQSTPEVREMIRRHGLTPIQWLDSIDFLDPGVIIGHAIFLSHHSQLEWRDGADDLSLLADAGAHVAHCPWVFARRGLAMESLSTYIRSGLTVGIGTDTCPTDMLEEMRTAAVVSKLMERDPQAPTAGEVFHAATVGGAEALGRDDLGRIAPGCRADLALIRTDRMGMAPARDPIKSLVYYGARAGMEKVVVGGRVVVENGRVPGIDESVLSSEIVKAQQAAMAGMAERDWAGRGHWGLSPLSMPLWDTED